MCRIDYSVLDDNTTCHVVRATKHFDGDDAFLGESAGRDRLR